MSTPGSPSVLRSSVGECNGVSSEDRWNKETPLFAKAIASVIGPEEKVIAEFGCGVGRIAKAVLEERRDIELIGLDDSQSQLETALAYVNDERFETLLSRELARTVDLAYCVYVLQHIPAVDLREALQRIHHWLKPGGCFIACTSEVRLAVCFDRPRFFDDRFLGVNIQREIERFFEPIRPLFDEATVASSEILQRLILGPKAPGGKSSYIPHHAWVFKRREITGPLFNVPR